MGSIRVFRLIGPGLSISLLPLLLLIFAFAISAEGSQAARMGAGPFDGQHCHIGEILVPPAQSAGHHTHNGFHSGAVPDAEWEDFSTKFQHYLDDDGVVVAARDGHRIVNISGNWTPSDQQVWHNHGDNDLSWWTPDEANRHNCNLTPEFLETGYAYTVAENLPAGTALVSVQAFDPDGDRPGYTLEGGHGNAFTIDPVTGDLETVRILNYEARSIYSFTVRARDPGGRSAAAPVTITVSNVEEPGRTTVSGTARAESTVTASLADPDGNIAALAWAWETAGSPSGPWTAITGATGARYLLQAGDVGNQVRATASYDDGHGASKSATSGAVLVEAKPAAVNTPSRPTQRTVTRPTSSPTPTAVPLTVPQVTASPTLRPTNTPTPTPTRTPMPTSTPTATPTQTPIPAPTQANSPPVFVEGETTVRTVGLETSPWTAVGAPVLALDPDGDPVTYGRDGTDMGYFVLDTVSGQVWTALAMPGDRQTLALRLWARDGRGGSDVIAVQVVLAQPTPEPVAVMTATPTATAPFTLAAIPTLTPTPTPLPKQDRAQAALPTAAPAPTAAATPTLDTSRWGQGRKIGTVTPTPVWDIPVVDVGIPRPPDSTGIALAQSGPVPGLAPLWPQAFLWLGGLALLAALLWMLLMAWRERRRQRRKDAILRRNSVV